MAHEELRAYSGIYLLSRVVDPSGEETTDTVVAAIASKYMSDFKMDKRSLVMLNSAVISDIEDKGWVERRTDTWWTLDVGGHVEIIHEYSIMWWEKGGVTTEMRYNEEGILYVNTREMKRTEWDIVKMEMFKLSMKAMFSTDGGGELSFDDIFDMCYERFNKGEKWDAKPQFVHACDMMIAGEGVDSSYAELVSKAWRIYFYWCEYLWEQKESGKSEQYILGLRSFISKNQEAWANGITTGKVTLRIYDSGVHDELVEAFEPEVLYMSDEVRILGLWTEICGGAT